MTTLIKRATPRQMVVHKMIAGAVKNAAHAHLNWPLDDRFVKSIAKRATGTLTAGWPDVLAAPEPSECFLAVHLTKHQKALRANNASPRGEARAKKGTFGTGQLRHLHIQMGIMAREAKHAGDAARFEAIVDCLRLVGAQIKK